MSSVQQVDVNISKKVFNKSFLPYLECDIRTQIFFGGSSAGKSQFVVGQRVVWDLLKGDRNYLIIRNVARTSRTSTFNQVKQTIEQWQVGHFFKINKSDMTVTCVNGYQALFEGLDDVEKLKSILPQKGIITDIIIEEATETNQNDVRQLRKRLRGKSVKPKRLTLLFNPILQTHWIYGEFFKGRWADSDKKYIDNDLLIQHFTYKDNQFLADSDIAELENEPVQYFYDVYTLGKWGVLGDVVFTNWRVDDLSPMVSTFDNIKNGLDFGFAKDPAAYNRIHYDKMRKKIYIFEEMHEYEFTNPMIAEWLAPIVGKEPVVCDSAEPKSIQELRNHNINAVPAKKGPDSVRHGIQFLQQHEIIVDRFCQETINELQLMQWKKLRDGTILNVPVDKDNHHIDDIRYALEDDMPQMRVAPRIGVVDDKSHLRDERPERPTNLQPGDEVIEVWENDKIVAYEVIKKRQRRPVSRGITGSLF